METIHELKYEYKFVTRYEILEKIAEQNLLKHKTNYSDVLNKLGKDGWELVSVLQYSENSTYIFKRSKWEEKKAQEEQEGQTDGSWNEEDENNLTDTCVAIRKFYHGTNGAQELIDWLKSFKDKYTWKPNEGQMEALDNLIINLSRNPLLLDNYTQSNIRSLRNDLKKFYGTDR